MDVLWFIEIRLLGLDLISTPVIILVSMFYEPYKYGTHAEKCAIMSVKNKNLLRYSRIYIFKIVNNEIVPAIPCKKCEKLLDKYKVTIKS